MHTVEQAKELWCPMVRHEGGNGGSFNRGSLNNNPTNRDSAYSKTPIYGCQCIGDQCAMWRWGEGHPMRKIALPARSRLCRTLRISCTTTPTRTKANPRATSRPKKPPTPVAVATVVSLAARGVL